MTRDRHGPTTSKERARTRDGLTSKVKTRVAMWKKCTQRAIKSL